MAVAVATILSFWNNSLLNWQISLPRSTTRPMPSAHPLSPAGLEAYDFAIHDSLQIRVGPKVLDVYEVKVRPKDDRQPRAVGAVYIDRETGEVVRMAFSFTRAALIDKELEDVSVVLENALIEGRFWLPRRQEIEIRRTGSWLDYPARGIIRGAHGEALVAAGPSCTAVRRLTETGTGRQTTSSSLAPERQRMPTRTWRSADCEIKVTSATSVRSRRLRSLCEVVEAFQRRGRSDPSASSSARGGSGVVSRCSVANAASASAKALSFSSQRCSRLRATRRFSSIR